VAGDHLFIAARKMSRTGQKDGARSEELMRLLDLAILDPELRAKRASERQANQERESIER
jgi:hypothetical protein